MSLKRDIFCFDFRSNFLGSLSFLINIGKEMSVPGFRKNVLVFFFSFMFLICSSFQFGITTLVNSTNIQILHEFTEVSMPHAHGVFSCVSLL